MPKDETQVVIGRHSPAGSVSLRRTVARVLGLEGGPGGGRSGGLAEIHEELFHMRGELALLRAELEQVRATVGRRDIALLDELLRAGNRREIEATIRDRSQTVSLPDGSVLCRILGRFKFFVDAADGGMAPHLLLDGYWQYWITEFVCRNLARGETAYDIGAAYGYYTLVMADLVGPGGRVVALEPNPWLHWLLQRNIGVNGSAPPATVHRLAVAEAANDALRVRTLMTGPFHGPFANWFEFVDGVPTTLAPAVPLDNLEADRVDFLRLGTAAALEACWRGMQGVLDRSPDIRLLVDYDAERCAEPAALVEAIAARFPLRFVDGDGRAKPCTADELLSARRSATLYLSRTEPR